MSVERCIAALDVLDRELSRLESYARVNGHGPRRIHVLPDDPLPDLIRDLTLDVDLRRDASSRSLMSDIESDWYLPVIITVLALLKELGPATSAANADAMGAARGLTQRALKSAHRAGQLERPAALSSRRAGG